MSANSNLKKEKETFISKELERYNDRKKAKQSSVFSTRSDATTPNKGQLFKTLTSINSEGFAFGGLGKTAQTIE